MRLIVGLGNPGAKYKNTRHNLGYLVIDQLAKSEGLSWRYSQDFICYFTVGNDFLLVKPTTYMNKSGQSVKAVANFYKCNGRDILIVCDDLDLDFGKIRLSFAATSAGHHGIESVIEALGTNEFARLRVGIGKPPPGADGEKYVLEDFSPGELQKIDEIIKWSSGAIMSYLADGLEATMNKFN